ncbi:MAG: thiosulfate oxidation carrier protein SoxY [Pseudomonadota bacterium]
MDSREEVDSGRRQALKTGGGLGMFGLFAMLGLLPAVAHAGIDRKAFEAKALNEALDALGALISEESALITLTAPDVAENGALVPVTVESELDDVEQISILADRNPTMLVAHYILPKGTDAYLSTRIRMAETSNVIVLVKAGGRFYRASKQVKVTAGGC